LRRLLSLTAATALCLLSLGAQGAAAAPTIPLTTFTPLTPSSVRLEADVNPGGKATEYRFEYGPADCSANPCTSAPVPNGKIAKGADDVRVTETIEGLSPATTYHFLAVAKNPEGEVKSPDRAFLTFALPPLFGPCPNDALRAGPTGSGPGLSLPDCRAYEQASPVDKNGTSLLGETAPLTASPNGDALSFESSTGIPGGEGSQNFPFYASRRDTGEWSTQGLLPHGSAGDGAEVRGWTRDLAFSYSTARREAAGEEAFLARSSADGSLETIVDYRSANLLPSFAGASEDGSEVFFEEKSKLLDEAAPNRRNLYAWDRAADELHLVGVLPDGSTPSTGSFAGPYDWVKGTNPSSLSEGGSARDYLLQDEHAISNDGSRAYFTASTTGQIYLRENPTEPSATTVNVSACQKKNGKGPNGCDAALTQPAAFMAATPDGDFAFFTSSEKLTNDATTGPEPEIFPAIAQAPSDDGDPVDLDFLPTTAAGLTVDATHAYWIGLAPDDGIFRAELDGDNKELLIDASLTDRSQDLAVDSEHIYWTNGGPLNVKGEPILGKGTIGRAELDGEGADPQFIEGASNPEGIDVNATHVYWANAAKVISGSNGTIGRAKLGATAEEVEQEFIMMSGLVEVPHGLALSAARVYWTVNTPSSGFVVSMEFNKSDEKFIFIGVVEMGPIATNATGVYWVDSSLDSIGKASLELKETTPEKEFIKEAGDPKGLAADASNVYWSANQVAAANLGNDLYRYDAETGKLIDLAVDQASPNGAEVRGVLGISEDGSRAYFVANGDLDEGGPAPDGDCQGKPLESSGACNLYLWEEGLAKPRFIAVLQMDGGTSGDAANFAETATGVHPSSLPKSARVSADGNTLLFRSQNQLSAYDNEGLPQYYRYDAQDESLLCVSCNPTGRPPTAAPTLGSIAAFLIAAPRPAVRLARNLSADGQRVFFETTEGLVPEDTNGLTECPKAGSSNQGFPACRDVYMWEANGSGSCESEAQNGGCLYLLSTGRDAEPSFFADAGATGDDAFLITSSPGLVFQDQDQLYDVYDARVEGGLQFQNEAPPGSCEGEGCKPEPEPAPLAEAPPSFSGPGDPPVKRKASKACPKGKRKARAKGRSRCVSKRKPDQNQRQRKARRKR
jgi:hypothetical protein